MYFSSDKLDVWDAGTWCQDNVGYLVEILTEPQMDFIIMELQVFEVHEGQQLWWTSGSATNREGKWYWQHTLQDVGTFVWDEGFPQTRTDNNYLCLRYDDYLGYDCYARNSEGVIYESHYICQQD